MQTLISHCAKGLAYIHCQNLAHMDIKPGNIFRQIENDSCVYKIGDLGLVCPHTETVFDDGDCRYIAREVIESISNKDNDLRLSDVFSLGKIRISTLETLRTQFRTDIFGSGNPNKLAQKWSNLARTSNASI